MRYDRGHLIADFWLFSVTGEKKDETKPQHIAEAVGDRWLEWSEHSHITLDVFMG